MVGRGIRTSYENDEQQPRVLRIGIILGGRIIEERLLRKRETITIGQSAKNTFSIPIEGLPRQWPLFIHKNGRYLLHFSDAMDGRISEGNRVDMLAALRSSTAKQESDGWTIPLSETSRGKIVFEQMNLLFQFVAAPPLQPRPHLPASVRGTIADRIDPKFAVIAAFSMLLHFSVFLWAMQRDIVRDDRISRLHHEVFEPDTYELVEPAAFQQAELPKEPVEEKSGKEDQPEPEDMARRPQPQRERASSEDEAPTGDASGPSEQQLRDEIEDLVITALSSDNTRAGGGGTGMSDRNPGTDLGDEIRHHQETGARATLDRPSGHGPRGSRHVARARGETISLELGEGLEDTGGLGARKVPRTPVIVPKQPEVEDETSLTGAALMAKIRSQYVHGLKQCLKRLLKSEPDAGGTIRLKFIVGERGNVTRAAVKGFGYATLDSCVEQKVMSWRFHPPKDKDGQATTATFKISLALQGE